jgi:hypothetical protein
VAAAWERYGSFVEALGVAYLAVAAVGRLRYALPYLLADVAPWAALDLKYRHNEVTQWFAGTPVYGVVDGAVYPPASHAILWPLLGWLPLDSARLLWALTILAAAGVLGVLIYRVCRPAQPRYLLLVAGLAFAGYPLQMSVFVGQLGVHVVACAAAGALLLFRKSPGWSSEVAAGILLTCSLVKPTLSLPIVVAALIAAGRARPAVLVTAIYAGLTLVAGAAQPAGIPLLFRQWLEVAGERVPILEGVPNLHLVLMKLGMRSWLTPASLLVLGAMTAWMWRFRRADPWVLLGIAGIVARIWAHSTLYDDAILLLPSLALLRIALGAAGRGTRSAAAWLFAAGWASLLTPTWAFYDLGPTVLGVLHTTHTILWLTVLAFLGTVAGRAQDSTARGATPGVPTRPSSSAG